MRDMLMLFLEDGLLDGQAVTTASLLISSALLMWFTKMAIKLRDQLVNSMSEIANSVVDKFVTSSFSSSSSSSDSLTSAANDVKGLAADIGIDGGGDDGGGDGGDADHGLYNDYGMGGEPGADAVAGDDAADGAAGKNVSEEDGRSGTFGMKNGDSHRFAATGSGNVRNDSISEDAAKSIGEAAMGSDSLASMSGDLYGYGTAAGDGGTSSDHYASESARQSSEKEAAEKAAKESAAREQAESCAARTTAIPRRRYGSSWTASSGRYSGQHEDHASLSVRLRVVPRQENRSFRMALQVHKTCYTSHYG